MKRLIEFIKESMVTEAFESSTIKEFYKKCLEILNNKEYKDMTYNFVISSNPYNDIFYANDKKDFTQLAKVMGLGTFKDEFLYKNDDKIVDNDSGIYNQEEVCKLLGISQENLKNISIWWNFKNSLTMICKKIGTCFVGLVTPDGTANWNIKKIHCGIFIDPKKGDEVLKHWQENAKKIQTRIDNKDDYKNNASESQKWSLERAIKLNKDIQKWMKRASDEQKKMLIDFVNWTQKGDGKFYADPKRWLDSREIEHLKEYFDQSLEASNAVKWEKTNNYKIFRYQVMKLMCQENEEELKNSLLYKRVNDNIKKIFLDTWKKLHVDLKELSSNDIKELNKEYKNTIFKITTKNTRV